MNISTHLSKRLIDLRADAVEAREGGQLFQQPLVPGCQLATAGFIGVNIHVAAVRVDRTLGQHHG